MPRASPRPPSLAPGDLRAGSAPRRKHPKTPHPPPNSTTSARAPPHMTPVTIPAMPRKLALHEDRLFPPDPGVRAIARDLYASVRRLPIVSPHGHTDPAWFAGNEPFGNATKLLLAPDHYLFRMLYSQGVPLDSLGVSSRSGPSSVDPRAAWRLFASHFH